MKRVIFICATFALITAVSIVGCKKGFDKKEEGKSDSPQQTTKNKNVNSSARFTEDISVSSYGFLVFPDLNDVDEFREFLLKSTHAEAQEYLKSIEFESKGFSLYGEDYLGELITADQAINYMYNQDEVFQIKNVVMKPTGETSNEVSYQFLLTVTTEYLSNDSYEKLAAGTFDPNTMNQFATNPDDESFNLFDFIDHTPVGHEDTQANATQAKRPMFGTVSSQETICEAQPHYEGNGSCVKYCKKVQHSTTYVFWIGFPHEDQILSSWSVSATGC